MKRKGSSRGRVERCLLLLEYLAGGSILRFELRDFYLAK
jgi:hypothetical protein